METEKRPKSEVNLRKLMRKMGLGTNAFAEACGMSSQSMAQFLRNKSLTTASIYRIAMALDIDPRDFFYRMAPDGTIIEEPKVSFEKLKEYAERERLGPLFAQTPQDAHKVLVCPNCATAFLVTNIPRYAEEKNDTKV